MRVIIVGGLGNDPHYFKRLRSRLAALDIPTTFVPFDAHSELRVRATIRTHSPSQCVLVGNSIGAMIAMRIATDSPVRRIVLINPPSLFPESARLNANFPTNRSCRPLQSRWWMDPRIALRTLWWARYIYPLKLLMRSLYVRLNPMSPKCVVDNIFASDLASQAHMVIRHTLQYDFWHALNTLGSRTHILFGTHDDFAHLARTVRNNIPNVVVRSYLGGHHHILYHPDELAASLSISVPLSS